MNILVHLFNPDKRENNYNIRFLIPKLKDVQPILEIAILSSNINLPH